MNKKIFTIFLIAALLIVSAGAVSAADSQGDSKSITVKINWDDAAKISERPNQVSVNLIKDGSVVDTVVLKESNSWKATFNAQGDGSFKVQASDINDYSKAVSGGADAGFIVTYSLKADVLGASDEAAVIEEADDEAVVEQADDTVDDEVVGQDIASDEDVVGDDNESSDDTNVTNETNNETDEDEEVDDTNTTDEETDDETADDEVDDADGTDDETFNESAPITYSKDPSSNSKNPITKEKVKKVVKPLKKNNVTKEQLRNTGLPLVVLVVAAFAAIFVPFSRRKN